MSMGMMVTAWDSKSTMYREGLDHGWSGLIDRQRVLVQSEVPVSVLGAPSCLHGVLPDFIFKLVVASKIGGRLASLRFARNCDSSHVHSTFVMIPTSCFSPYMGSKMILSSLASCARHLIASWSNPRWLCPCIVSPVTNPDNLNGLFT